MSRRSPHPDQFGFTFEAPMLASAEAELAGFDRLFAASTARILKADDRSRAEIAGAMSALLAEEVSPAMLDAYASTARDNHNISAHRFFALVAVTAQFDELDRLVARIGARLLVGDEIKTAELGHIDREIARLKAKKRDVERMAAPIARRGSK
jgi:hypothetical protein